MPKVLTEGVRRFHEEVLPAHLARFNELAGGQNPDVLFVTCSDSRVDPNLITSTGPGEIFVLRNAGNVVPVYGADWGSACAVEYAVSALKVGNIVVCGHSSCGAVGGALDLDQLEALPAVKQWCSHIVPAVESSKGSEDHLAAAVEANVFLQIENLKTHPAVKQAVAEGRVKFHAWVFDIGSGTVRDIEDGDASL